MRKERTLAMQKVSLGQQPWRTCCFFVTLCCLLFAGGCASQQGRNSTLSFSVQQTGNAKSLTANEKTVLHSTGQLHKGDGNNGVFLILSTDPSADIKIPGQQYTFGQLCNAQALGDFQALESKGRRAIKLHLKQPLAQSIQKISDLF